MESVSVPTRGLLIPKELRNLKRVRFNVSVPTRGLLIHTTWTKKFWRKLIQSFRPHKGSLNS